VPDWICEVLSPATAAFDRSRKSDLYAELGVGHLWLVDVTTRQIEAFRQTQGKWLRLGAYAQDHASSRSRPCRWKCRRCFGSRARGERGGEVGLAR
jgi:Uma2 family endonuclease